VADPIDIDTRRKVWAHGHCVCGLCGHRWIGVVYAPRWWGLECPACSTRAGVCLEVGLEVVA
jgi:hypothetical protein